MLEALGWEIAALAFAAAVLNGMIGYGFTSTVTPIALLWVSNRVLNPALVLVELGVNSSLLVKERAEIRATWPRARGMLPGLVPGALLGAVALSLLAATPVKIAVYLVLLPLIGLQLWGVRRPIAREGAVGPAVGAGIGFTYALTTISGPPLAVFWRNQGLSPAQFRCAMAQVRVIESSLTIGAYAALGLFQPEALTLVPYLLLPVLAGVPLGVVALRRVARESFGIIVMAADGLFVSYGVGNVLESSGALPMPAAIAVTGSMIVALTALVVHALRRGDRRTRDARGRFEGEPPAPIAEGIFEARVRASLGGEDSGRSTPSRDRWTLHRVVGGQPETTEQRRGDVQDRLRRAGTGLDARAAEQVDPLEGVDGVVRPGVVLREEVG